MEYFVMYLLFSTERIAEFMSFFGFFTVAGLLYFFCVGFCDMALLSNIKWLWL